MEKLVEDACLEVIDTIYDRGGSMTKGQINKLYEEVWSWVLLELYETS